MTDVERRFGEAMFAIYREARDIGYTPRIFFRMLNEKGALQTARRQRQGTHEVAEVIGECMQLEPDGIVA